MLALRKLSLIWKERKHKTAWFGESDITHAVEDVGVYV
jgi:hypothetical protein